VITEKGCVFLGKSVMKVNVCVASVELQVTAAGNCSNYCNSLVCEVSKYGLTSELDFHHCQVRQMPENN